jgi:hypothetical protein
MRSNILLAIGTFLAFGETAGAVSFTNTQAGPNTWVYTLTFAPEDNYSVTQGTTTITMNGLVGVTAATGPTSTDFPSGPANTTNLAWTAQVTNGGTTVVWTHTGGGTGNFSTTQHAFGFSITSTGPNGTASLVTSGFSRDIPFPLPGGGLDLDITGNVVGPATTTAVVLPQIAFGGGWYSAVYFTNTGSTPASFSVKYTQDNGTPMIVPSTGTNSVPLNLGPQATAIVETPNAGAFTQGYATAQLPPGVIGYGVFRQSVPGVPDQEAVSPLTLASTAGATLTFDETSYITGVAIANPTALSVTVTISAFNSGGTLIGTTQFGLAPFSHSAQPLRAMSGLGGVVGQRGSAVFSVANGNLAVLGLRFFGPAFTSMPAFGN